MKIAGQQPARSTIKEWSWSYSKLKNYRVCPKRMYEVDLCGNYKEEAEPGGPLDWGNRVHKAMADNLKSNAPFPADMDALLRPWAERVRKGAGELFVEQKYAITRDFQPVPYFDNKVWLRTIGDVVRVNGDLGLVLDWKTGKVLEDHVQLMLMAQALFSHFPTLKYVRAEFVWLKDDCTSPELFTRQEVADDWVTLLDEVNELENATKTSTFPPKPNNFCRKHCPVNSCVYHGKGAR